LERSVVAVSWAVVVAAIAIRYPRACARTSSAPRQHVAAGDTLRVMDFICLAAGHGTRLGRLGRYLQKCMYPVGLRPFLEHSLVQLMTSGVAEHEKDSLALVVGHHAEQVKRYFGASFEGLPITYVEQRERLGTGHALKLAHDALRPQSSIIGWQADLFVTAA